MKWCFPRHDFALYAVRILLWPYLKLRYGFKAEKFRMSKDKPYLVLANHRGYWDPFLLCYVYNRPIHFMATDNLFTNGLLSRLLIYWLAPIAKKKQGADLKAVRSAMQVAKENGVVGVFPEGSRSYDGESTSIDLGIAQLAKLMKADILVCGMFGVYAADPRWGTGNRRGNALLKTVRVITAEEAAGMDDELLRSEIAEAMDINEAVTKRPAKASKVAEKLESFIYVCPKCGSICHIYSKGNEFGCTACGMHGTMDQDLTLNFDDEDIRIRNLAQWHRIQRRFGREFEPVPGKIIFSDDNVEMMISDQKKGEKISLGKGKLFLTDTELGFISVSGSETRLQIKDIKIVSPVGMSKLLVNSGSESYFVEGFLGFNGYKYSQIYYTLTGQPDREVK